MYIILFFSRYRFKFIAAFLRFDDPETRKNERWKSDRFAAAR